jgi:hypothetical protein
MPIPLFQPLFWVFHSEKSSSIAKKLFSEGRVHYLIDGDYSENSGADKLIKEFILSYK